MVVSPTCASALANRSAESSSAVDVRHGGRRRGRQRVVLGLTQRVTGLARAARPPARRSGRAAAPSGRARTAPRSRAADSSESSRPPPTSSARESTAMAFTGVACDTSSSWKAARKSTSVVVQVLHQVQHRVGGGLAILARRRGSRRCCADGLPESAPMPGVSISVIVAQRGRRPLHVEPLDVVRFEPAEVDGDGVVEAVELHGARVPVARGGS